MMEYFRQFLVFLRKKDNEEMNPNFITRLAITACLSIGVGILIDVLLPFNFLLNGLRGFVANLTGFSTYSITYLISLRYKRKKKAEDRNYETVRKRFSYRQRLNISLIVGTISAWFVLMSNKENFSFTLTSALLIYILLIIIAFARRNRNEFIKGIYELPDTRDLEFMTSKKEKKKSKEDKGK